MNITSFIREHKRLVIGAAIVIGLPLLALAWWLGSPLFIDRTVDEEFPRAAMAEVPADMTAEEVEDAMVEAEDAVETASDEMPDAGVTALVSGEFSDADDFHRGSGTATIYELDDGSRVLRLEDLDVTNGPDLHVLLTPASEPVSRESLEAADYVDLGGLKGNIGNQNYDIPADVDVGAQMTVVIYCQPFHVVFSTAALDG